MTFMRLRLEIDGKPDLHADIQVGSPSPSGACRFFSQGCHDARETGPDGSVNPDFPGGCKAIAACSEVFSFFMQVVSYEKASAVLHGLESPAAFNGSAQCVAAFSLLCCLVHSGCGYLAEYAFLLRSLCRLQGQAEAVEALGAPVSSGRFAGKAKKDWYARFIERLGSRTGVLLDELDRQGGNDTLRNACQILYSVGSLARSQEDGQDG